MATAVSKDGADDDDDDHHQHLDVSCTCSGATSEDAGSSHSHNNRSRFGSDWEEGVAVIDSLLLQLPNNKNNLTPEQVAGLQKVRTMLLLGRQERRSSVYDIPKGLLPSSTDAEAALTSSRSSNKCRSRSGEHDGDEDDTTGVTSMDDSNSTSSCNNNHHNDATKDYLLAQFGGVVATPSPTTKKSWQRVRQTLLSAHRFIHGLQLQAESSRHLRATNSYPPPEWLACSADAQAQLARLLSWDHLRRWSDFDVFAVTKLTRGQPLLFVGWAILGSPYAQHVMQDVLLRETCKKRNSSTGNQHAAAAAAVPQQEEEQDHSSSSSRPQQLLIDDMPGYGFCDQFKIPQQCLVDFLRTMENDYQTSEQTPYHNNIHAADVLQSLHAILCGMQGSDYAVSASAANGNALGGGGGDTTAADDVDGAAGKELQLLAVLLSAVVHDAGHQGYNNSFHVRSRSDLALVYNDASVLENMHVSLAFRRLLYHNTNNANNSNTNTSTSSHNSSKSIGSPGTAKSNNGINILQGMSDDQVTTLRKLMIEAVLNTDMTKHFYTVNKIKGIRHAHASAQTRIQDSSDDAWEVLHYALHMADISNPAKRFPVAAQWADRCLDEFFLQGDEEKKRGLPVSPLCDRTTTNRADSQIGFIEFVVKPAFEELGKCMPQVASTICPIVQENLELWKREKAEQQQQPVVVRSDYDEDDSVGAVADSLGRGLGLGTDGIVEEN